MTVRGVPPRPDQQQRAPEVFAEITVELDDGAAFSFKQAVYATQAFSNECVMVVIHEKTGDQKVTMFPFRRIFNVTLIPSQLAAL